MPAHFCHLIFQLFIELNDRIALLIDRVYLLKQDRKYSDPKARNG